MLVSRVVSHFPRFRPNSDVSFPFFPFSFQIKPLVTIRLIPNRESSFPSSSVPRLARVNSRFSLTLSFRSPSSFLPLFSSNSIALSRHAVYHDSFKSPSPLLRSTPSHLPGFFPSPPSRIRRVDFVLPLFSLSQINHKTNHSFIHVHTLPPFPSTNRDYIQKQEHLDRIKKKSSRRVESRKRNTWN